jgi:hypothetical protein
MYEQSVHNEVGPLPHTPMIPPRTPAAPADQTPLPAPPLIYLAQKSTWQYKQITCKLAAAELLSDETLNRLGAEGWELTGLLPIAPVVHFYFKRRTP